MDLDVDDQRLDEPVVDVLRCFAKQGAGGTPDRPAILSSGLCCTRAGIRGEGRAALTSDDRPPNRRSGRDSSSSAITRELSHVVGCL